MREANFKACVRESTGIASSFPCSSAKAKDMTRSRIRAGAFAKFPASLLASAKAKSKSCATKSKMTPFWETEISGSSAPSLRSSSAKSRACVRSASSLRLAKNRKFFTRKDTCRSFTRFAADLS
eukprot:Skav206872  [mRNA]  locus=scaffold898:120156:121903:+ [translate_table: standard]